MPSTFPRIPFALLLVMGLAAPVAAQSPVPPLLSGVTRIVTLGDSITQGGGQPGGYVWLLDRYLNAAYPGTPITVVNAGISGIRFVTSRRAATTPMAACPTACPCRCTSRKSRR